MDSLSPTPELPRTLAPPPREPVWPVFVGLLATMVGNVLGGLALYAIAYRVRMAQSPGLDRAGIFRAIFHSEALILSSMALGAALQGVCAFLFARPLPFKTRLRLGPGDRSLRYTASLFLICLGIAEGVTVLFKRIGRDPFSAAVSQMFKGLAHGTGMFPVTLLLGCLVGPLAEELFFRGFVQTRLVARWGPAIGIGVTSMLFGLLHLNPAQSVSAFLLGLALGWGAFRSRSIWPGALVHCLINASFFLGQRFLPVTSPSSTGTLLKTLALAGILGGCGWLVRPRVKPGLPVQA